MSYNPANIPTRSTLATLKGLPLSFLARTSVVYLKGSTSDNDGNQGLFYWDAASVAADDTASTPFFVVQPNAVTGAGRLLRLDPTVPTATKLGGVKALAAVAKKFLTSIGLDGLPVAVQPAVSDLQSIADQTFVGNLSGAPASPSANLLSLLPGLIAQFAAVAEIANFTLDGTATVRPVNATGGSFNVTMPILLKGFYLIPKTGTDGNPVPIYDDATPTPNLLFTLINGGSGFALVFSDGITAFAYGVQ